MGEFLKDCSVSNWLCPFSYQEKVNILESLGALRDTAVHEIFTTTPIGRISWILKSLSSAIKEAIFGKLLLVCLETLGQTAR